MLGRSGRMGQGFAPAASLSARTDWQTSGSQKGLANPGGRPGLSARHARLREAACDAPLSDHRAVRRNAHARPKPQPDSSGEGRTRKNCSEAKTAPASVLRFAIADTLTTTNESGQLWRCIGTPWHPSISQEWRADLVAAFDQRLIEEIERLLCRAAGSPRDGNRPIAACPHLGAVSLLHRFGSACNHHVHLHACAATDAAADMLRWKHGEFSIAARVRIALLDRDVLPRRWVTLWAANWVGPGRSRKSTWPRANGVVELSPFDFLDRLSALVPRPESLEPRVNLSRPMACRPSEKSSCRSTTTGQSCRLRLTSCPRSTPTASDRCRTRGHDKAREAAGLGEAPRRPEKNATPEGKVGDPGSRFPDQGCLGRREQPAHEPLIRRAIMVEVPLTGLSFHHDR
jgi:hypothetical protein